MESLPSDAAERWFLLSSAAGGSSSCGSTPPAADIMGDDPPFVFLECADHLLDASLLLARLDDGSLDEPDLIATPPSVR
jgi:hypothetical protein